MSPYAQGRFVDAFRQSGGVNIDDALTRCTHGQAAAHRTESADGNGFLLGAAYILAVFGGQGPGRTHADAGSTKRAAGLFQAHFMDGGGTGAETAQVIIDGTHGHQLMVGPDAFAAQDALA